MRDLGGLAGWLGVQGKGGVCRGGGSLGSGATRTWPPPWPPRGLPPPVGQSRKAKFKTLNHFHAVFVHVKSKTTNFSFS